MNNRAQSEKGFSLIELLVVVAIIGVLAAVGVVGYQGYIDSTKKSVTETNAKAVHQWLINTKTVRAAGIDVDPSACSKKSSGLDSTTTVANAIASAGCFGQIAAAGAPFESFKNPYTTTRTGSATILAASHTAVTSATACSTLKTGAVMGDIILRVSGAGAAAIDVYYCAKVDGTDDRLTLQDTQITNF